MEVEALFLTLGGMFVIGLGAHLIGSRTAIPRVTLLLLSGLVAGQMGLIPEHISDAYEFLSITALTLVAFLLGGSLKRDSLRVTGRRIMAVSLAVVIGTVVLVSLGLIALGVDPALAIVLAGIATATDPAATTDVIRQSGVQNDFTRTIEGVVAVDDAWGLLAFSLCLSFVASGAGAPAHAALAPVLTEIGGGVALGLAIGLPGALVTGRIGDGEPLEVEALALVFLTAGFALWAEVSFLIAGMTAGAVIANLAAHHDRAFHEIKHLQWPFMVLFFLLAGAMLDLEALRTVGWLGLAYVALRIASRIIGGWLGAQIARAPRQERPLYGIALLPQAGVAVGMALIAAQAMPEVADQIIALTIGTTIAFELIGPVLTLWALKRTVQGGKENDPKGPNSA